MIAHPKVFYTQHLAVGVSLRRKLNFRGLNSDGAAAGKQTFVHRQAGGVPLGQVKNHLVVRHGDGTEWELRDVAHLVFHVHVQITGLQHAFRLGENLRELAGRQPVFDIVREPGLQPAQRVGAQGAAAIYEPFVDARHFGDMGVGGNEITIGQLEAHERRRILREDLL